MFKFLWLYGAPAFCTFNLSKWSMANLCIMIGQKNLNGFPLKSLTSPLFLVSMNIVQIFCETKLENIWSFRRNNYARHGKARGKKRMNFYFQKKKIHSREDRLLFWGSSKSFSMLDLIFSAYRIHFLVIFKRQFLVLGSVFLFTLTRSPTNLAQHFFCLSGKTKPWI